MLRPRFLRLLPIISSVTTLSGRYRMIQSLGISSLCIFYNRGSGEKRTLVMHIIKRPTFFPFPPLSALIHSYWCRHFLPGVTFNVSPHNSSKPHMTLRIIDRLNYSRQTGPTLHLASLASTWDQLFKRHSSPELYWNVLRRREDLVSARCVKDGLRPFRNAWFHV